MSKIVEVKIVNEGEAISLKERKNLTRLVMLQKDSVTTMALWYWAAFIEELTRTWIILSMEPTGIVLKYLITISH